MVNAYEQLEIAIANVKLLGDPTWFVNDAFGYRKANYESWKREIQISNFLNDAAARVINNNRNSQEKKVYFHEYSTTSSHYENSEQPQQQPQKEVYENTTSYSQTKINNNNNNNNHHASATAMMQMFYKRKSVFLSDKVVLSELVLNLQLLSGNATDVWQYSNSNLRNQQFYFNVNVPEFYPKHQQMYAMPPPPPPSSSRYSPSTTPSSPPSNAVSAAFNVNYRPRTVDLAQLGDLTGALEVLRPAPTVTASTRRLYSAVLQSNPISPNPSATAAAAATTTPIQGNEATTIAISLAPSVVVVAPLESDLEQQALEQYQPSEDNLILADEQELERLAIEQYESETSQHQ